MANIKAGTQIINVAISGETPNISANKSLIALIVNYYPYNFIYYFLMKILPILLHTLIIYLFTKVNCISLIF
jgi:hypothetical protein